MLAGLLRIATAARLVAALAVAASLAVVEARAETKASTFVLGNGMQVVVIPDHRVPVVTHMVWYRVGAADDPVGRSGLAHFLEHLMFKSTERRKTGEFTRVVNRLGGRHNALTSHDTTSYFQRVAKEHLKSVMELEADRMTGVRFIDEEVRTERDVVREERRSSVEANPISTLNEQMMAILYGNHTYGRPVLGFAHEIMTLSLDDARAFYARHYAPGNAILVIAGDITADELRPLAEATYGRVPARPAVPARVRLVEPEPIAARTVRLEDRRAGAPLVLRFYHVPSHRSGMPEDTAALAVLAQILGGDDTSRLYRRLVVDKRIAAQSGADYQAAGMDWGRMALLALAGQDLAPAALEAEIDHVVAELRSGGVTAEEIERAKFAIEAARIFEADSQEKLARRYGEALTIGRTIAEIEGYPARVAAVTAADVKRVAEKYLVPARTVTGHLVRPAAAAPKR